MTEAMLLAIEKAMSQIYLFRAEDAIRLALRSNVRIEQIIPLAITCYVKNEMSNMTSWWRNELHHKT